MVGRGTAARSVAPRLRAGLKALACAALLGGCAREHGPPAAASRPPAAAPAGDSSPVAPAQFSPPGAPRPDSTTAIAAADVVRAYYAAIAAHDYRRAWLMWGSDGTASGKSYEAFRAGFAHTAGVAAQVGPPGVIEGAAGSRYCEVPVTVEATTDRGARQRFAGTYVMRRTVVEGSTPQQLRWHISSARLREA
jgi:hypothetical protein